MTQKIKLIGGGTALLDAPDYLRMASSRWHLDYCGNQRYAARWALKADRHTRRSIRMHELILEKRPGFVVDHINGNTLDNRRSNLRYSTHQQNLWNRQAPARGASRFRGVTRQRSRWRARICSFGHRLYLGSFDREVDAATAYDAKCRQLRGAFAAPNFTLSLTPGLAHSFIRATAGRFFTISFIKRFDGSNSVMSCRTSVGPPASAAFNAMALANGLISVWDARKRDFRFIPTEGILWIRFKHRYISFTAPRSAHGPSQIARAISFARRAG